jgi:selenophosphate synthetase-related protein
MALMTVKKITNINAIPESAGIDIEKWRTF